MKLLTQGRALWSRTIGSTLVGQAVDTTLVIWLTFFGTVPSGTILTMIVTEYLLKVAYEVLATPFTYLVIAILKRAEHSDPFDATESFSPFPSLGRPGEMPGKRILRTSADLTSSSDYRMIATLFLRSSPPYTLPFVLFLSTRIGCDQPSVPRSAR